MFKELVVWQKAMKLVREVYSLTKSFPMDERYALTDQIRRAVVSIPSNIAEGGGRYAKKIRINPLYTYDSRLRLKQRTIRCTATTSDYD